jgi:O-antigen ligase
LKTTQQPDVGIHRAAPFGGIERVLVGLLAIGALVLPLVFDTASSDVFALPKTIAMLALTALLLPGALVLGLRRGALAPSRWSWLTVALAVYLTLNVAATLHSADQAHSLVGEQLQFQGLLATLGYAVAFAVARASLVTERRLRWLVGAVVLAGALASLYGVAQQLKFDPIWQVLDRGRIFSTLGQANALAAYLVLALPLAIAAGLALGWPRRVVAWVGAGLVATALALTLSRGGYLGAVVAVASLSAVLVRRSMVTRRRLGVAAAVLVVVAMAGVLPPVQASLGRVVQRAGLTADVAEGSNASHLDLWAVGVRIAAGYPLLGAGPEMYPTLFATYRDSVLPPARARVMASFRPESPHDVPIAIADAAGLPALLAYLAIILGALAAGWKRLRASSGAERLLLAAILAAVLGHVVTDLFMTAEVAGSWTFWVLLGVLAAGQSGTRAGSAAAPAAG